MTEYQTAEQRVKAKWPDATGWGFLDSEGFGVEITDKSDYDVVDPIILGVGRTRDEAWLDAASRLDSKEGE